MKRPIRILLTVPHLNPTASPYKQMIGLARYLPRDEFKLTICTLRKNGEEETGPLLKQLGVDYLVARFRPRGKRLHHYKACIRDQKVINQYGPFDIQQSMDFTYSPIEALLARFQSRFFVSILKQTAINGPAHQLLLRSRAKVANRMVPVSGVAERILLSIGVKASKVRKVYNGFDFEEVSRGGGRRSIQDKYILYVAHITRRKRQHDAIVAFSQLADQFPALKLKLAGTLTNDPSYVEELKRLTEELHLEERVEFLGLRSDTFQLMQDAEATVLCSEREAFGWVVVESMAAGTPVVATAVEGPSEIIEDRKSGLLVPVGDTDGFARTMRELLQDPVFAGSIALSAQERVESSFSVQSMVEGYSNIYRELMQTGGSR